MQSSLLPSSCETSEVSYSAETTTQWNHIQQEIHKKKKKKKKMNKKKEKIAKKINNLISWELINSPAQSDLIQPLPCSLLVFSQINSIQIN